MTRTPENPAAERAPVARRVPPPEGGSGPVARVTGSDGKTPHPAPSQPPQVPGEGTSSSSRPAAATGTAPATGTEGPANMLSVPGRERGPRTPAGEGRNRAAGASLAGSQALRGEEWRQAVREAQRKTTRRPAARAAPVPSLPPSPGSAPLIATASCIACGQIAGPGPMGDVDRVAEKHARRGHSTATVAELGAGAA